MNETTVVNKALAATRKAEAALENTDIDIYEREVLSKAYRELANHWVSLARVVNPESKVYAAYPF